MLFADTEQVSRCVVRITTAVWQDKRGLHNKKTITFLRRKCAGFNILDEEISATSASDALREIVNLDECGDGVYEAVGCNETHDFESGYVDGYDIELIPFRGE